MRYDIAKSLYALYDYIQFRLIQANVKKDKSQLEEARNMLVELRDTWAEAMKMARGSRAMAR
jgi:flagellar protein FliS